MSNTLELDNQIGVINTLQARVTELEHLLEYERRRREADMPGIASAVLKALRLQCVIPLYVGSGGIEKQIAEIEEKGLLEHSDSIVWDLTKAPVNDDVKAALRTAANNGSSRW